MKRLNLGRTTRTFLAVLVASTLILGACSNGKGNETDNSDTGDSEQTGEPTGETVGEVNTPQTIRFWSIYPEGDPNYAWTRDVLDRFMADNENITVEYTGISFWDYFTKITTSMVDRSGPDVFIQTIKDTGDRARGGVSLNLSQFMDDETNADLFYPQDIDPMIHEGKVYGLPYALDNRVLYYNRDLVDTLADTSDDDWLGTVAAEKDGSSIDGKPADLVGEDGHVRAPVTWDELHAYQELLTVQQDGRISQLGFDVTVGNMMFVNVVWNKGGSFFDSEGNPTIVGNDAVQNGFQTWYDLTHTFPQARVNAFLSSAGENATNLFWNQTVALMISTNEIPWQNDALPEADRVNLGAAPVPYDGIEANRYNFTGGFSLEMAARLQNEDRDKQVASWLLIKYLTSKDIQKEVLLESANMPGNIEAINELSAEIEDEVKITVLEQMEFRRPYDSIYNAPNWFGEVQKAVTDMVSDRVTIEQAMKTAEDAIKRLQATY